MTNISFTMYSGNTHAITMPVKNAISGTAVDLTACSGIVTIAEFKDPFPEEIFCSKPITIVDATNGIISFQLDPENTFEHTGIFPFDVKITFGDGAVQTVFCGWVSILSAVNES